MKQFLLYLTQIVVPLKSKVIVSIFLLGFGSVFSQNAIVGSGFSSGWGGGVCPTGNSNFKSLGPVVSGTYGVTTTANGTGDQTFRFGVDWDGITAQLAITPGSDVPVVPNTTYSLNTSCTTSGAMKYNVLSTSYNYVFKTLNAGTNPTGTFVFFEVQGAVRSVTAVEQSPLAANVTACLKATVTATLDGALATGQKVYLRYTNNAWTNSTVVEMTGSGTSYTGIIPSSSNTAGAVVSYYVFTSGDLGVATNGSNADLYTINLKIDGASNYTYTVVAGGATTAIPNPAFEQALIALNLDCAIDGQVFTSNISGVTELDVSGLGIANLTGIEAFSSLLDLYCADNALSSLNVSMLSNLRYLDLENNLLTVLNVTGLNNLTQMVCWKNKLTSLDLSSTPNLVYLDCDDNAFTSLDVSKLPNLNQFYCSGNQLTSLDVRGLTNLIKYGDNPGNFECTDNFILNTTTPSLTCILVDDVPAANTANVTVDPTNDPISPYWKKDSGVTYSYCSCSSPITWDGTAWSNVTGPTSQTDAIIAGPYSQSAPISACSLTIKNGATVTIPSGTNVTLNAPLTVETGGSFTLSNNANLIQSTNVANTGNVLVNRNSNSLYRSDYTMWSSPVASQNLLAFSPLTTITPDSRFYTYDSATDKYSGIANPSTSVFAKGAGYLIRMPNTDPAFGYDAGTATLVYPGVFTGVPNTGNVTLAVTAATYNAIGNPYPSTISADDFITANGITEALYFWRKRNNLNQTGAPTTSYATYTKAGGTGTTAANTEGGSSITPNGTIQVGQGFIAKATSATLLFTNAIRTANNSNQILKTKAVEKNRVWVNLTNSAGAFSQMMVAYMSGATQDIDAAIDGRYFNDSQMALNSLINSEEFVIQGRALPFDGTDIVPLAFKTDLAGDYTIAIDHVDGLFSGSQDVFLKDNNTGIETNLKAGAYTFTAAAGVDNTRFSLEYQKTLGVSNLVFNDDSVTVHKNKGTLYVNSDAMTINNIKVFDIQGRLIAEQKNVKSNTATIKDLKATQQVLIVKITSQDNKVVSKKVVN
jgi:hypothetical protein